MNYLYNLYSNIHLDNIKILAGRQCALINKFLLKDKKNIHNFEFNVFSQFGDDGIIQYLISKLPKLKKIFIEFGVENYRESNTRFLLVNNNWTGLVMDASKKNIDYIRKDEISWRYDIHSRCEFITKDNINTILKSEGYVGSVGILSIDIDGNDYWVWKAITVVNPAIVIVEYNSTYGSERHITIPYQEDFIRTKTHFSNLYWGTSLGALYDLAKEKGYIFIGCNSAGNNAYFICKDIATNVFKPVSLQKGYVEAKFRESRDKIGNLTFLSGKAKYEAIKGMPVYNTKTKKVEKL